MSTKGVSQPHNSRKRKRSNKNSNESNNGSIGSNERPAQACPHSTSSSGSFGSDQNTINPAPNELRLVLLGKTGAGKSATGNTILGNKRFDDGLSAKECKRECVTVEERELVLVDTPDFFDTTLTKVELQQVICCLALSSPGPHAFLLVIPIQLIEEQQRTVEMILEMFLEDVTHHTILIFSHADRLRGESIEGFISRQNQKVQELVERFERRFVAFDNTNTTNRDQVGRLLEEVDELLAMNENRHYTSEITEAMQKAQKIIEEKLKNKRIIQIKTEVNKLADQRWREFTAHMNEVSEETDRKRKRIQRRIDGIEKDIEKEKQNVRPIPARLTRFRASLHTEKENLRRLLNREKMERTEKEDKEKKDLEIWKKEEEQRRLSEEEKNYELFSDDNKKWLIMLFKFLLNLGVENAPILLKYLFPAAPVADVRSSAEYLASLLGLGAVESVFFGKAAEAAVNIASKKLATWTHCFIQ